MAAQTDENDRGPSPVIAALIAHQRADLLALHQEARARALPPIRGARGADRNQPCPCGSGRKAKRCCGLPPGRGGATSSEEIPTPGP